MSINSPGFLPCLDSSPSESDTLLLLVRVIHYGMLRTLRHLSFQKGINGERTLSNRSPDRYDYSYPFILKRMLERK
ncbi:hypothetical protein GQ55_9G270500 [Panicum hallii var. hallii]|uniref:Uncharacterized protein n=1 Tax=Panicum hallii var. hallii TaxID=1504633 RepID=A0A2T7C7D4_9POAL|nr:hypothetical protein GQ55_9G270500 [Panicum hallii var. hallii]